MSEIQELLERILERYPEARRQPFEASAPIRQEFDALTRALARSGPVRARPSVAVRRSVGIGKWASVPWVALADARETETIQRGTYVAFLFSADASAVALCVTQGTTEPLSRGASGRAELAQVGERVRARSGRRLHEAGFETTLPLDLHATTRVGRDHEKATIAFKQHPIGSVPDDEQLLRDIDIALAVVDEHIRAADVPATVAAIYVGEPAQGFLRTGLEEGVWGWRRRPRSLDGAQRGILLAFGSGYTGGAPRIQAEEWRRHALDRVVLARTTTALYEDPEPLWDDERRGGERYPHRIRFEVVGERRDVELSGALLSRELADAFRRSAISQSRPIVVADDDSKLLHVIAGRGADTDTDVSPGAPLRAEPEPEPASGSATLQPARTVGHDGDVEPRRDAQRSATRQEPEPPVEPDEADLVAGPFPGLAEIAAAFREAVDYSGLYVPTGEEDGVNALIAALVTKPFTILTGLSGSGKTQIALRLGEWFGRERLRVVAVRPDWTGPEALFGYENALRPEPDGGATWFVPETLEFLLGALRRPRTPHLLLLDEMNLAHVERYFSDYLSGVESGQPVVPNLRPSPTGWRLRRDEPGRLPFPRNVFVIGTVNVDETTYLFSPKVLDRATTFELRTRTDDLRRPTRRPTQIPQASAELRRGLYEIVQDDEWHVGRHRRVVDQVAELLVALHRELARSGDEFGHRAFRECLRFAAALREIDGADADRALDHVVLLKLLPRIHGSRQRVEPVLRRLLDFAAAPERFLGPADGGAAGASRSGGASRRAARRRRAGEPALPRTAAKVRRMLDAVVVNQFVSFTE